MNRTLSIAVIGASLVALCAPPATWAVQKIAKRKQLEAARAATTATEGMVWAEALVGGAAPVAVNPWPDATASWESI